MKAKNMNEAWTIAREIFPTDYQKDENSSARAGYSVYRSTAENRYYCYICDLGDRLELNLDDGRTINIWIRPAEDDEAEELTQICKAIETAREYGKKAHPFTMTSKTQIVFSIGNYGHESAEEKQIYNALRIAKYKSDIIYELAAAYCKAHGLKWSTMDTPAAAHYGQNERGHFIISCYIMAHETAEE